MATGYSSEVNVSGCRLRCRCDYSQSTTATKSTIQATAIAQMSQAYLYGTAANLVIQSPQGTNKFDKTATGALTSNPGASWAEVCRTPTASLSFTRTGTDQIVLIWCRAYGAQAGGYSPAFSAAGALAQTGFALIATLTIPKLNKPAAPTNLANSRANDSSGTISWAIHPTSDAPYDSQKITRSVDGGAYSDLTGATALSGTVTSYKDLTRSAGHSYSYKVTAVNVAGSTTSAASATIYNTPNAPTKLTASRNAQNQIELKCTNPAGTQTATEFARSADKGASMTVITPAVTGASVIAYTDVPGGGTFRYCARNVRTSPTTLRSAWSAWTADVSAMMAPKAPTLTGPVSGATVSMATETVRFDWVHNPQDGSAQSAARIQLSKDDWATSQIFQISNANAFYVASVTWDVNDTVKWKVQTKGAHADYSPYSTERSFTLKQVPQVDILSPADDDTVIDTMPLDIAWDYSDMSGTLRQSTLRLKDSAGAMLWGKDLVGDIYGYQLDPSEFLLLNDSDYLLEISVTSTSGLSASTQRGFATHFLEPAEPDGELMVDRDFGSVAIQVFASEEAEGVPETVSLSVYREQVLIADGLQPGSVAIDRYPPLDSEVTYTIAALTATGVSATSQYRTYLESGGYAYINFGDGMAQVLRLGLIPSDTYGTEHDREGIPVWGKRDPIVRIGGGAHLTGTLVGKVWRASDTWPDGGVNASLEDARSLDAWDGIGVVRRPHQISLPALCDVQIALADEPLLADVTVSYERVSADGLYL